MTKRSRELEATVAQVWTPLRLHASWAEEFWVAWLFTGWPQLAMEIEDRLAQLVAQRGQRQRVLRPENPEAVRNLLEAMLADDTRDIHSLWIEVIHSQEPDAQTGDPWSQAWDWLMMRANEHRSRLSNHLAGGLIFVGVPAFKQRTAAAAPDLWSIRSLVLEPTPPPAVGHDRDAFDDRSAFDAVDHALTRHEMATPAAPDIALARKQAARMRARGNRAGEASALMRLAQGLVSPPQGRVAAAKSETLQVIERVVELYRELAAETPRCYDRDLAKAMAMLAYSHVNRRDFVSAQVWYQRAVAIIETHGGTQDAAKAYLTLGAIVQEQRDLAAATTWYQKARVIFEKNRDEINAATTYHQMGTLALEQGDLALAAAWYQKARVIREQHGDENETASTYHQMGILAQKQHDFAAAAAWYQKAHTIREKHGDAPMAASTYHQMGNLALQQDDLAAAEDLYRKALAIHEKHGDEHAAAQTCHQLGIVAGLQQRYEQAGAVLIRCVLAFARTNDTMHAQQSTASFRTLYDQAPPEIQTKLRAQWQMAKLPPWTQAPQSP